MTPINCAYVDSHRQVPLGGIVGTQPVCTSCADDLAELGFEVRRVG